MLRRIRVGSCGYMTGMPIAIASRMRSGRITLSFASTTLVDVEMMMMMR